MDVDVKELSDGAKRLFDYWTEKRGDRDMPLRADIEPTELGPLLPNLAILDIEREGKKVFFRHRLVGTEVVEALGKDSTGRRVGENLGGTALETHIYDTLLAVTTSGLPKLVNLEAPWSSANKLERLILPLATEDGAEDGAPGKLILYFSVVYDAVNPQAYVEARDQKRREDPA